MRGGVAVGLEQGLGGLLLDLCRLCSWWYWWVRLSAHAGWRGGGVGTGLVSLTLTLSNTDTHLVNAQPFSPVTRRCWLIG